MEEIWKDVPGFSGYQASTLGRIRTHNKISYTEKHGARHWKDRILKYKHEEYSKKRSKQGMGYRVDLWKDGKPHTLLVHRIVASTFLEDHLGDKMTVNHKDGNRLNNNIKNLEWLSRAENIQYGFENGQYPQKGVTLVNTTTGEKQDFRSYSQASLAIGANTSYVSNRLRKGKFVCTINGAKYEIIPSNKGFREC